MTDLRAFRYQKPDFMAATAVSGVMSHFINSLASAMLGAVLTIPKPQAAGYVEPAFPPGPTGGRATVIFSSVNQALCSSVRAPSKTNGHWRIKATLSP